MPLSDADLKARQEALASLGITTSVSEHFAKAEARQARREALSEQDRLKLMLNGLVGGVILNPKATEATISAAVAKATVIQNQLAELGQ